MEQSTDGATIGEYLASPLSTGEPTTSGPLTVYPVFGPDPRQTYVSLKNGITHGLTVKELPGGGSVRDLVVTNPSRHNVLIFEGEEVLGAQQNRTFDLPALIRAGSREVVPVSCVEAGRWQGSRNAEEFRPSPQAAHPKLREEKVKQSHRARMAGMETRADQGAVWSEVSERSASLGSSSPTDSLHDAFETSRSHLAEITGAIESVEGQFGAICVIGGEVRAFDLVSRPEVFADLYPALLQGYALDAIVAGEESREVTRTEVEEFIASAVGTRILERDGVGLGRDFRFESESLVGAGLVSGEELIQLSVFPGDQNRDGITPIPSPRTRIRRPSTRRDQTKSD